MLARTMLMACLGALVFSAAASRPLQASCESAFQIRTPGSIRLPGSCEYCAKSPIPNFTPSARVDFWSLGTGDPRPGFGDDNGEFQPRLRGSDGKAAILPYDYSLGVPGHIQSSRSDGPFYNYYMTFNANWAAAQAIDGCVSDASAILVQTCTCLLMTDQFNGRGYFGLRSAAANDLGDFDFERRGVELAAVPMPRLDGLAGDGGNISIEVQVPAPTGGIEVDEGCDCAPTTFRLYGRTIGSAEDLPFDRDRNDWEAVSGPLPLDAEHRLTVPCSADSRLLLATALVFPDGFETRYLSEPVVVTSCGAVENDVLLAAPPPADVSSADFERARKERQNETKKDASPRKKAEWPRLAITFGSGIAVTLLIMFLYRKLQGS